MGCGVSQNNNVKASLNSQNKNQTTKPKDPTEKPSQNTQNGNNTQSKAQANSSQNQETNFRNTKPLPTQSENINQEEEPKIKEKKKEEDGDIEEINEGNRKFIEILKKDKEREQQHKKIWQEIQEKEKQINQTQALSNPKTLNNKENSSLNEAPKFKKQINMQNREQLEKYRKANTKKTQLEELGIDDANYKGNKDQYEDLIPNRLTMDSDQNSNVYTITPTGQNQNVQQRNIDPILQQINFGQDSARIRPKPQIPNKMDFDFLEEKIQQKFQENENGIKKQNFEINEALQELDNEINS